MAAKKKNDERQQWCEASQEERHNASPRPTSCMFLKEESHKDKRKTASTWPCGPRCSIVSVGTVWWWNCILGMTVGFSPQVNEDTSFDLSSSPVPSPAWREIFTFSDDGSV